MKKPTISKQVKQGNAPMMSVAKTKTTKKSVVKQPTEVKIPKIRGQK